MTAPVFIAEAETAWGTNTTPKATGTISAAIGNVAVAFAGDENFVGSQTITGTGVTLTLQQEIATAGRTQADLYAGVVSSAGNISASIANAGGLWFGGNLLAFSGSDGIGASAKVDGSTNGQIAITTTQANSAVVVVIADFNATDGTSRTWLSSNGAPVEVTYFRDGAHYTVYGAYYPDVGAAGLKTLGLSAPGGLLASVLAVEIRGAVSAIDDGFNTTGTGPRSFPLTGAGPTASGTVGQFIRGAASGGGGGHATGSTSGAWSIRNASAGSATGAWSVRNKVIGSSSSAWSVRNATQTTVVCAWSIRNTATGTANSAWSVRASSAGAASGAWSVLNHATGSADGAWSVNTSLLHATGSASGSWSVLNHASAAGQASGSWSIRNTISSGSAQGAWSIRNAAQGSTSGAWSIRNTGAGAAGGSWSIRNAISSAATGSWSIKNSSVATAQGSWSIRNSAQGSADGAWSVDSTLAHATGGTGGAWSVRNSASGSADGAWSIQGEVPPQDEPIRAGGPDNDDEITEDEMIELAMLLIASGALDPMNGLRN